jgi:DNA-binding LacI/PurR family transcriptional regulator
MATIADVAREAGVSRSTVSSVLTGKKFVRPETRQRIERAIEQLNFRVNSGARALATSRTMIIGVIVQFHGGEFGPALVPFLVSLSDSARAAGFDVLLITEQDTLSAIHRLAYERRVDGVVLLNVIDDDPRLAALRQHDLPAVLLGMPRDSDGIDAVDLDFAAAARALVKHLYEHGHREALFVRWAPMMFKQRNSFVLRFSDAALSQAAELGMTLRPVDCPVEPELVPAALHAALAERGDATAVLIHNDAATALLPTVLHRVGLEVPSDMSVVSIHSAELGRSFALPFTSVETVPGEVSELAIEALLRRMAPGGVDRFEVTHELLSPHITDRGSVETRGASRRSSGGTRARDPQERSRRRRRITPA